MNEEKSFELSALKKGIIAFAVVEALFILAFIFVKLMF